MAKKKAAPRRAGQAKPATEVVEVVQQNDGVSTSASIQLGASDVVAMMTAEIEGQLEARKKELLAENERLQKQHDKQKQDLADAIDKYNRDKVEVTIRAEFKRLAGAMGGTVEETFSYSSGSCPRKDCGAKLFDEMTYTLAVSCSVEFPGENQQAPALRSSLSMSRSSQLTASTIGIVPLLQQLEETGELQEANKKELAEVVTEITKLASRERQCRAELTRQVLSGDAAGRQMLETLGSQMTKSILPQVLLGRDKSQDGGAAD